MRCSIASLLLTALMAPATAFGQDPCDNAWPDSCQLPITCCVIPDSDCPWHYTGLEIVYFINYFKGGPKPTIYSKFDVNCDCRFNTIDVTYLYNYFARRGPAPKCCFYICRLAPTPSAIGDFVWLDSNRNGIQDSAETGIAAVTVSLFDCAEPPNLLQTTATDTSGHYLFSDLERGDYRLGFAFPSGYEFSPMDQGSNDSLDSDADPLTGLTICVTLDSAETDLTWDAGMYISEAGENCTRSIGFWKNHAGFGPQPDLVTPLLPIWMGLPDSSQSIHVNTAQVVYDVLRMRVYGVPSNGITRLYAQLLGAKLNIENGADGDAVSAVIDSCDSFLATHGWLGWNALGREEKSMIQRWQSALGSYNEGTIGPGPCDNELSR